jgi:FecR protein
MSRIDTDHELLLRSLDRHPSPQDRAHAAELLRSDPSARAFLREVAEQAVIVADLERMAAVQAQTDMPVQLPDRSRERGQRGFRAWPWTVTAASIIALLTVVSLQVFAIARPPILRVSKVTGSTQYLDSSGRTVHALGIGTALHAGDTLETRSCDAWIELELRNGSTMTIAGNSTLRILDTEGDESRFHLVRGNLWVNPAGQSAGEMLSVRTPTATVTTRNAQLDVQTSDNAMIARVNRGTARVTRLLDDGVAEVPADHQVIVRLGNREPLPVTAQPKPVTQWVCDLSLVPEVILGKWLPPTAEDRARLGAAPLLWPVSENKSVMLYAVALAAWKISDRPVLLQSESRLRFRGRTERLKTVRFGFSTQRMRGVFAGKFEIDVTPQLLGPAGETWEVELPLADFRPLHPQLSSSPAGLELTDVYALTINDDAGLEANAIELVPPN